MKTKILSNSKEYYKVTIVPFLVSLNEHYPLKKKKTSLTEKKKQEI